MTREIERFSVREAGKSAGTSLHHDVTLNAMIQSNGVTKEITGTHHHPAVKLNTGRMSNGVTGVSCTGAHQDRHERPYQKHDRRPDVIDERGRC